MKNLILVSILFAGFSAQAELQVVTMPITGASMHVSKFEEAENSTSAALLVRTADSFNECLLDGNVLKQNNTTGVEFNKHLQELSIAKEKYTLSCYTQDDKVIQATITKSK